MSKKYDNTSEYSGAGRGMRLVFTAALMQIISAVLGVIATVVAACSGVMFLADASDTTGSVFAISVILGILCFIAQIVAYILNLVGLGKARNSEIYLQSAFMISIFGLVCIVVAAILSCIPGVPSMASSIGTTIGDICEILIVICVCTGCANLLDKLGDEKLVKKAAITSNLFAITFAISVFVNLLSTWVFGSEAQVITIVILAIVSVILQVIAYIFYITFLKKASKDFLAEARVD